MNNAANATTTKRDPRAEAVLESLREGCTFEKAYEAAGVDRKTFWRWRKADALLAAEIEEALYSRVRIVEDALFETAQKGNVTAQMFWLMNRAPDMWKDKRRVPSLVANATANAEVQNVDAARKRLSRNMHIVKGLRLDLGLRG